jgi:CarD family transcriptional regulator
MEMKRGDYVVHPAFGVGLVESIEERKVGDDEPRVFYRVGFSKMTVWVPIQIPKSGGLRPVTPRGDLNRYSVLLKSHPETLDTDFRKRQIELDSHFKQGTFQALCEVVRDLSARSYLKSLSGYEVSFLKKAREILNQEWAATSGKSLADATNEIEICLLEGRQKLAS